MEVDDLYTVPPEEFVAARNALVKELKAAGEKADAAVVAKLKRPSAVAWALNQVARSEPALVTAAIAAGQELRAASEAAMAGDPDQLRSATTAERAAATAVAKATAPFLGSRAAGAQSAVLATLRVAGLDASVADELRRGLLTTEHEQPGFGFGGGLDDSPVVAPPTKRPKLRAVPDLPPEVDEEAVAAAKAERAAAKEAERKRKKERLARQRTADRLTKEAVRLAKEADEAEAEAVEARQTAEAAQARADAAIAAVAELD